MDLKDTIVSNFQGNRKNWGMEALGGSTGGSTRGPGSGAQQILMNRKESGCTAEEAYRARDGCISLVLF